MNCRKNTSIMLCLRSLPKTRVLRAGCLLVGFWVNGQNRGTLSTSMPRFIGSHNLMAFLGKRESGTGCGKCVTEEWRWSSCVVPRLLLLPASLQLSWSGKLACIPSFCHDGPSSLKAQAKQFFSPNTFSSGVGHRDKMLTSVLCCPENRAVWKWFFYCSARQVKFKIQTKASLFLFKLLLFCSTQIIFHNPFLFSHFFLCVKLLFVLIAMFGIPS